MGRAAASDGQRGVFDVDEDRALELSEALAGHSLVYVDSTRPGPRSRMLETVREFVAERLTARPDADQVRRRHAGYYRALAEQALASTQLITKDAVSTIEAIVAEIDRKLSEQINLIIHNEDFKALEGTWRGLHYLVNNTETDEKLKIRVMNISKKDAARNLKKFCFCRFKIRLGR